METIRLSNLTVELVDEPAKTLSSERRMEVVNQCIPVARSAFGNDRIKASDIIKHALEVQLGIYVSDQNGRIVAFTSRAVEELEGRKVLYLGGSASQHKGLYGLLTGLRILQGVEQAPSAVWMLSTRTQSPLVFRNIAWKYRLFPQLDAEPTNEIKRIAGAFAAILRDKYSDFASKESFRFDETTLVHHRAYGERDQVTGQETGFCMYGDPGGPQFPWCDEKMEGMREIHEAINRFFSNTSQIDVRDGDAVLIMGRLDNDVKRTAIDELYRSLTKNCPNDAELVDRLKDRFSRLIA